ncbi:MAG TPA: hypothetical protein VFU47_05520 [Armatimonadota bacterium]|nr:hypothetical protein [Armatimonadota bacterium]
MEHVVQLEGLRARVDPEALAQRRLSVVVDAARVRVSHAALELLARNAPASVPLEVERVERIDGGRVGVRASFRGIGFTTEIRPLVTPEGRVRVEMSSFRAVGLLPLPPSLVLSAIRARLPELPGLYPGQEDYLEIDPVALARGAGAPVEIPPVAAIRAEHGVLEIDLER